MYNFVYPSKSVEGRSFFLFFKKKNTQVFGFSIRKIKYFYYKKFWESTGEVKDKGGKGRSTLALPSREKDKTFCSISAQWKRLSPIEKNDKEEEGVGGGREKEKESPHLRVICRDRSWWLGQSGSEEVHLGAQHLEGWNPGNQVGSSLSRGGTTPFSPLLSLWSLPFGVKQGCQRWYYLFTSNSDHTLKGHAFVFCHDLLVAGQNDLRKAAQHAQVCGR